MCTALICSACTFPNDADGTLARIEGGTLRVGVIPNAPWITDSGGALGGIEVAMITALSAELHARIEWVRGPAFELMRALEQRELDLVAGGLTCDLLWRDEVAFTRPYFTGEDKKRRVFAAAPGENAWLVRVERFLALYTHEIPR
jgi:polar amino acid transport system substrate-binding protein